MTAPTQADSPAIADNNVWTRMQLDRWVLALVALGIAWRLTRYALGMPVWGDEALVGLNLMNRNFSEIFQPLEHRQVAPPLFLAAEWLMLHALGASEYVMRLLPLLCGIAALLLFWRWTRLILPPPASVMAVAIYALGYYPVRHSVELKPYGFDMLATMILLYPTTLWLIQPQRRWPFILLIALTPFAIVASYPAVFTAGAISLALLFTCIRTRTFTPWLLWLLFNIAMLTTFLTVLHLVSAGQYDVTGDFMRRYWQDSFPPANPLQLPLWLLKIHTGGMFAYPIGSNSFGSTATTLLTLIGIAIFWRSPRRSLLILLLTPFALTMIAAAMQRYPYGGSARIAQHVAPAICLLAGAGIAWLIDQIKDTRRRPIAASAVLLIFIIIALVLLGRDILKPYKTLDDQKARTLIKDLLRQAAPSDTLVVLVPSDIFPVNYEWYLRQDPRVRWISVEQAHWTIPQDSRACWVLVLLNLPREQPVASAAQQASNHAQVREFLDSGWRMGRHDTVELTLRSVGEGTAHCEILQLQRP